jgi:release factor glutamine methyltransferase
VRVSDALSGQNLPKNETEILLSWILSKPRSWLFAHGDDELTADAYARFAVAVERRRKSEPVQHITGRQEFYGRLFTTDARALVPRGSTEELVRIVLDLLNDGKDRVEEIDTDVVATAKKLGELRDVKTLVDIGTGSGVIGITLALERPDLRVIATDVSEEALTLARENAKTLGATIDFRSGDCLDPVQDLKESFILISNPPYIPVGRALMKDVIDFEPHVALFGGKDGGDIARRIVEQASSHPFCRGYAIECMRDQLKY